MWYLSSCVTLVNITNNVMLSAILPITVIFYSVNLLKTQNQVKNYCFSSQLKRSPVVALFVWWFLVSSIVLSLSEAKNTKNSPMTFQNINQNIIYHKDNPTLLHELQLSKNTRTNNHYQRQYSPSSRKHRKNHRNRHSSSFSRKSSQKNNNNKMDCHLNPDPVWIRNDCTDGFLAITSDRRVATLNSQIDQHDNLGKNFLWIPKSLGNGYIHKSKS